MSHRRSRRAGQEYPDAAGRIREVLVHGHYLSQKDVKICLGFDPAALGEQPAIESILRLHECLKSEYSDVIDAG